LTQPNRLGAAGPAGGLRNWAEQSTSPLEPFGDRNYGDLRWSQTYPYKGREARAQNAAGNGGKITMAAPELDLVTCFVRSTTPTRRCASRSGRTCRSSSCRR
jgi:hypothetical protein